MEGLRELNDSTGTAIPKILLPTLQIFGPLLQKNKSAILSIPRQTHSYGPHPRQQLDIYLPSDAPDKAPLLVFAYGGGLIAGDKIVPDFMIPDGLMYHNLGTFFANRGFRTIVCDYRRVNSSRGGEDAVFPSGGEDISLVLKWLETYVAGKEADVFLMGNSAGGLHACTFLLEPTFLEQRKSLIAGGKGLYLKGFVDLSVPHHFRSAASDRMSMLEKYFGSERDVEAHCPYGLLTAATSSGQSRTDIGVPKILVFLGEFDPEDEIAQTVHDFVALWKEKWGEEDLSLELIKGHNHISPPPALMSGEGEQWGDDAASWMKGLIS